MNFEGFRSKNTERLKEQVEKTEGILGEKIYPPDISSLETLDISDVQTEYKTRYDAYVTALRAERRGKIDTKEIQHAKEWIKALNNLDKYIKDHESKDNPLLREKQFIVFKKIRDFLEQGKRKGYIKLPTGTGKTVLFLKIAEALDMKTFVVSPSLVILGQNAEETEEFTESEFGKYYGLEKNLSKKVTHITYDSLVNTTKDGVIDPESIPILILDEAHRALGPERIQTIKKFKGLQLGFTATSEFSEEKKVADLLEEEIFRMEVKEAIQEGLICQTQTIHAYTDVDLSSVEVKSGQYDQKQLEKVLNVQGRNMAALELYKNKFSPLKAICNCSGIKHAEEMARIFNKNGFPAACITKNTSKNEREKIFKDYKNGTIKILTNAKVLIEGFNEPTCAVTLNLHPTLSLVDAEQRARSGRLDKDNLDKWSYVVDFIDQNSNKPQVLYSEILKSDKVWDITKGEEKESPGISSPRQSSEPRIPINFEDLSLDGLRVVVDSQKIMEITNNNLEERKKVPEAPEGWFTASSLNKEIRRLIQINSTADKYRESHPEWFEIYRTGPLPAEHFHPDLVSKIKEELMVEKVPEGWMSAAELEREFNNTPESIKLRAEKYRESYSEWFKNYKNKATGQVSEHFHPSLVLQLRKDYKESTPPEGWFTMDSLWRQKILKSHYTTIKKIADMYRESHPEWFKVYNSGYKFTEHYSPELIKQLKEDLPDLEAPEGWVTFHDITKKFGKKVKKETVESYRAIHPEWFKNFKKQGSLYGHYAPELVKAIEEQLKK